MAPQVELARVKALCDRPETFTRAQALYSTAKARTGPGSSFSIDDQRAALPAICALLASQELQNNDVSQEVAQKASCVTPRAFSLALRTVRQALQSAQNTALDTPRPNRNTVRATAPKKRVATFDDLGREFDVGADHIVGMNEARQELVRGMEQGSVRARKILQPQCETLVACVIFHWACKAIKRRDVSDKKLRVAWDIDLADWKHAENIVDEECRAVKESLIRSAAASSMPTPSSTTRKPSKKDDLMANLLRGSDPKAKVVAEDAGTPSKENVTRRAISSLAPAVRFIGAPIRAPLPVSKDEMNVAQRSPTKRKADDSPPANDGDLASPRKRPFAPTTPSKLRAHLTSNADDESTDDEQDAGPSKLNLKAKLLEAGDRAPSQTPATRRYIGQRPPNFLPSPSASPLKASTPTKDTDATPTKSSKPKPYPASLSKHTSTPTPTKKKEKAKAKVSKPTRRVTRAASRAGYYYETSDSELDLDDEALADPSRNLFTQAIASDDDAPSDSEDDDGALRRRAVLVPGGTARLLMRGGQRVERVFRDRQALYQVEPVLAAKLRAWKRAQAALDASPQGEQQQQQQRKRKARA